MINCLFKKEKGFTLAETVVYIAVMGIVLTGVIAIILQLIKLKNSADSMRTISNEATGLLEKMTYDVRNAESFTVVSSSRIDIVRDTITYSYYLQDGAVYLDDGSSINALTTNMVQVNNFEVDDWTTVNSDDLVHISIQFSRGSLDETFQTSVHKR